MGYLPTLEGYRIGITETTDLLASSHQWRLQEAVLLPERRD